MKNKALIIIVLVVFVIVAVVIYLFAKSGSNTPTTTTTTTNTGLGNLLDHINIGQIGALLKNKTTGTDKSKLANDMTSFYFGM